MDNNNHSIHEHVFGQSVGPAIKIDLLKNRERAINRHKPKSKQFEEQRWDGKCSFSMPTFIEKHH